MIARGAIFAMLRSQMLDVFPDAARSSLGEGHTLGDWLEKGSYQVQSCSNKAVRLEASNDDVACAVLCEIENLLNHCLEHLNEIHIYSTDTRLRSDAWAIVTTYYLGFFASSALLRLIGRPTVFFSKRQSAIFKELNRSAQSPSAGSFQVKIGHYISSNVREVIFEKSEKVHESTWKSTLGTLGMLVNDSSIAKHPDEAAFYDSLSSRQFCPMGVGYDWPSWVRNRVNYRPGNSYKLNSHQQALKTIMCRWMTVEKNELFELVRFQYRAASSRPLDLTNQIPMMICISMSIFAIARELYFELLLRRKLDSRWELARRRYRERTFTAPQNAKLFFP